MSFLNHLINDFKGKVLGCDGPFLKALTSASIAGFWDSWTGHDGGNQDTICNGKAGLALGFRNSEKAWSTVLKPYPIS